MADSKETLSAAAQEPVKVSQSSPALGKTKYVKPAAVQNPKQAVRRFSDSDQNDPEVGQMRKMIYDLPFYAIPGMGSDLKSMSRTWSKSNIHKIQTMQKERKTADAAPIPDEIVHPDSYGWTVRLVLAVFCVLCGSFMFGFNIGCLNTMSDPLKKDLGIDDDSKQYSWALMTSLFAVGGALGAFIGGNIVNKLGRKITLSVACFFMILSCVMEFYCNADWQMWVARTCIGIAAGGISVVVPLYLGEIAPANLRGALGTMNQLFITFGILVGQVIFRPINNSNPEDGWRYNLLVCALPGVLQLALYPILLESPRWLVSVGRDMEAESTLRKLRGTEDVDFEISTFVQAEADVDKTQQKPLLVQFWNLMKDKRARLPLLIGVGLQAAQQFSGVNVVFYYSNDFFSQAGVSDPWLGTVLASAFNMGATAVAVDLMDRAGRRVLILLSCAGMFLSAVVLTIMMVADFATDLANYIKIGSILFFVIFFELGLGPIPWLIVAELFGADKRATAMSLCSFANWFFTFCVGIGFPYINQWFGDWCFLPFIVCLVVAYYLTYMHVPETSHKSLEQIQAELNAQRHEVDGVDSNLLVDGSANEETHEQWKPVV